MCCVTDAPIIDCESAAAYVDDFGVFLRCEVRSRPPLTSIYWLIDDNNTVVMDGESVGDYWSIDMVRPTNATCQLWTKTQYELILSTIKLTGFKPSKSFQTAIKMKSKALKNNCAH